MKKITFKKEGVKLDKQTKKELKTFAKQKKKVNQSVQNTYLNYESIENGRIIVNDKYNYHFMRIIPFSLSLYSDDQILEFIEKLEKCIIQFNYPFELYVLDGQANLSNINDYWQKRKANIDNEILKEVCDQQINLSDPFLFAINQKRFYLRMKIVNKEKQKDLQLQCFQRVYSMMAEDYNVYIPKRDELKEIVQYYFSKNTNLDLCIDDEFSLWSDKIEDWSEEDVAKLKNSCRNFKELISPLSIQARSNYVIVDDYAIKTLLLKRKTHQLKKIPVLDWIKQANLTTMIYFDPINKQEFINKLDKDIMFSGAEKTNKTSDEKEAKKRQSANENLIDTLQDSNSTAFHVTAYFQIHTLSEVGTQQKELDNLIKGLILDANTNFVNLNPLNLFQKEAFIACSPFGGNDEIIKKFGCVNLLSDSISAFYPFNMNGMVHRNGYYKGYEIDDQIERIIDDNKKDLLTKQNSFFYNNRDSKKNKNLFATGASGMGKTTILMGDIIESIARGENVFISDVEHEYDLLIKALGGVDITIGKDSSFAINPLEPVDKKIDFSSHIQEVMRQISFYRPRWSDTHKDLFESYVIQTLEKFGITHNTNFADIDSNDYPIYSDVLNVVYEDYEKFKDTNYVDLKYVNEIKHTLNTMTVGSDKYIFNVKTSIPKELLSDKQKIINFDLKTALQSDPNKKAAAIYSIIRYLNMILNNKDKQTSSVYFDEVHVFLRKDMIVILQEITNFFRRIRKYGGRAINASQGISEYLNGDPELARYASALISQCNNKAIFNLGDIDYDEINAILRLSEEELKFIQAAKQGECLFSDGQHRIKLSVSIPNIISKYNLKKDL